MVRDETSLQLYTQPLDQCAIETFINPASPAIIETFQITNPHLAFPKYQNWTAGLDQRLPGKITLRLSGIRKTGTDGLAYIARIDAGALRSDQRAPRFLPRCDCHARSALPRQV